MTTEFSARITKFASTPLSELNSVVTQLNAIHTITDNNFRTPDINAAKEKVDGIEKVVSLLANATLSVCHFFILIHYSFMLLIIIVLLLL